MLKNNPTGFERAEIERVVGNQYNRRLRQQHNSKALSASGSTTTANRGDRSRREEEETAQPIRGQLLQLRKEGSPR